MTGAGTSTSSTWPSGRSTSVAVWAEGFGNFDPAQPLPAAAVIAADLTDWRYQPPLNAVAIENNKAAFEWGRQAAQRPLEVQKRVQPGQIIEFKKRETVESKNVAGINDYWNSGTWNYSFTFLK